MTTSSNEIKIPIPIFLLADGQLLFWKNDERLFLNKIKGYLHKGKELANIKAAHPDWSIESVRHSLIEIEVKEGEEKQSLILPLSKSSSIQEPEKSSVLNK